MGLLLAPLQLSADWSFACIPPVEALADPRNLATAALYAWLLWVLVFARPWQARRLLPFCCDPGVLVNDENLATAALYAWLLWVLLSARPWQARRLLYFCCDPGVLGYDETWPRPRCAPGCCRCCCPRAALAGQACRLLTFSR